MRGMRISLFKLAIILTPTSALGSENLDHYFSFMGFHLEKTELSEIREVLGDAPTHQEGDAANSYTAICYRILNSNITIYFESGEMGGGKRLISYRVNEEEKPDFPCGQTDDKRINKYSTGALKIGSNTEKTIESLPSGIESRDGNFFFYYTKIPFTEEEIEKFDVQDMKYAFWDQGVTIQLFIGKNTINGYRVTKVTSW